MEIEIKNLDTQISELKPESDILSPIPQIEKQLNIDQIINQKRTQILELDLEIQKLEITGQQLKTGILASLWMDEPAGGLAKIIPYISIVITIITLLVVIFKN